MTQQHEDETVAAVDLGSNSFHMVIARNVSPELRIVDRVRERVGLAGGLAGKRLVAGVCHQPVPRPIHVDRRDLLVLCRILRLVTSPIGQSRMVGELRAI